MNASIPQSQRSPASWLSAGVWLAVFASPTAYFLLLLAASELHVPKLPATVVWSLLFVIPVVALLVCESIAWSRSRTLGAKISWMALTLFVMLSQFGIILVILRAIFVTRIGYVQ